MSDQEILSMQILAGLRYVERWQDFAIPCSRGPFASPPIVYIPLYLPLDKM